MYAVSKHIPPHINSFIKKFKLKRILKDQLWFILRRYGVRSFPTSYHDYLGIRT